MIFVDMLNRCAHNHGCPEHSVQGHWVVCLGRMTQSVRMNLQRASTPVDTTVEGQGRMTLCFDSFV